MSTKRKTSSGLTKATVPTVGLPHHRIEPPIRKVSQPPKDVLKPKPFRSILLALLPLITQKPKNMLQWIKDRLREASTYQGATGLAGAIGYTLNPEMVELIGTIVIGIISLIQMAKSEKIAEKKDQQ